MKIAAIVLASGKNRRLGRSKALVAIGGKSLIECVVERLEPLTNQILIVTSLTGEIIVTHSRHPRAIDPALLVNEFSKW